MQVRRHGFIGVFLYSKIMIGWIKLHRNIIDWEWFNDKNALKLLIYLNCKVNIEDKMWKGELIKRGSLVTGKFSITEDLEISIQQYRTALDKLIKSGEVTKKATNRYTILSLTKWEKFQHEQQTNNKPITNKQQTNNKRIYPTKEYNNNKNLKNEDNIISIYPDFEDFWELYDYKKGSKKKLEVKWNKLRQETKEEIMVYIPNYKLSQPDKQFRKHPTTFLNNESWKDELIFKTQKNGKQETTNKLRELSKSLREGQRL